MNTLQSTFLMVLNRLMTSWLCHIARHESLLQHCLVTVWKDLEQHVIDTAIDQWRCRLTACVNAKGGHLNTTCKKQLT